MSYPIALTAAFAYVSGPGTNKLVFLIFDIFVATNNGTMSE